MLVGLLVSCGAASTPGEGDAAEGAGERDVTGDDRDGQAAVAPECDEVDQLVAQVPDGIDPLVTGAEPTEDGVMPDLEDPSTLHQRIQRWGQQEAPDSFAGVWVHDDVGVAVAFAEDVETNADRVREEFHPGIAVAEAETPYGELRAIQQRIQGEQMGQGAQDEGAVRTLGVQMTINRTTVGVFAPDEDRLAELSEAYGTSVICFKIDEAPEPLPDGIEPLAKASGWRDGLEQTGAPYAVLEIAYDQASAEQAWADNVPDELNAVDDELPADEGLYGELDEVDLDRQAIVVWSSGESGSCPSWLADIRTGEGQVHVAVEATARECTADYNPYRMLLAVDLDRLPDVDELPLDDVQGVPDGEVSVYPSEGSD